MLKSRGIRQFTNGSFGYQYLFPGIPVTRLYFDREIDQIFGEYLLNHPKFGQGNRAITNLNFFELYSLFGTDATAFTLYTENFSASGRDYLFMKEAAVTGQVKLTLNDSISETLEFNASRFVPRPTVEVISELVEEGLFNAMESAYINGSSYQNASSTKPVTTIICITGKTPSEDPCLSKKNISIGAERYFANTNLKYISFRDSCPSMLPDNTHHLKITFLEAKIKDNDVKLSMSFSFREFTKDGNSILLASPKESQRSGRLEHSSSRPECATVQKLTEDLIRDLFQNR